MENKGFRVRAPLTPLTTVRNVRDRRIWRRIAEDQKGEELNLQQFTLPRICETACCVFELRLQWCDVVQDGVREVSAYQVLASFLGLKKV